MSKDSSNTKSFSVIYYSIFIAVISLLVFFLSTLGFVDSVNNIFLDALQGEIDPRDEIIIVAIDDDSLNKIGSWPWDRSVFADALSNIDAQEPAVIGTDVLFLEAREGDEKFQKFLSETKTPVVLGSKLVDDAFTKSIYKDTLAGFVNFEQDPDGKIRSAISSISKNDECELSFSLQIVSQFFLVTNKDDVCGQEIKLRANTYKTDANHELTFAYSRDNYKTISFKDVLDGNFEEGYFSNKIVMIGSTALDLRTNLNDNFTSIFGDNVAGVEIHANIVNSYLNNTFYQKPNLFVVGFAVLIINFLIAYLDFRLKKIYLSSIILGGIIILNFFLSVVIFNFNFQAPFVQTTLAFVFAYLVALLLKYTIQNKESRYVKGVFSRYLNPALLEILISDTSKLRLGGETKQMTVLFSDIRGFTSISEKMTPQELITMINDYLGFMTDLILKNNGTIDKYIGDAIMAFWNAPTDDPNHALNGVKTAIEMKSELKRFVENHPQYPEIKIGIGVNSGDMTVGNVGGERRFDYTVLGDNVNLGARLEGLTKKYGVTTIVSENTYNEFAKEGGSLDTIFRLLDEVKVKGKENAIKIYEPMINDVESKKIKEDYEKAFTHYQDGRFTKALEILNKTSDPASGMLKERITEMKNPPADWKGVWKWDEK